MATLSCIMSSALEDLLVVNGALGALFDVIHDGMRSGVGIEREVQ